MKIPFPDGPQVESRPISTPYQQLDTRGAFGEDMTRALGEAQQVTEAISQHYAQSKAKADAVQVMDAVTALREKANRKWLGDLEQQASDQKYGDAVDKDFEKQLFGENAPGVAQLRGKAAVGGAAAAFTQLKQERDDLSNQLTSDNQKRLFAQHSAPVLEEFYSKAEGHANEQVKVAEADSLEALQSTTLAAITSNYADDKLVAGQSRQVETALRALHSQYGDDVATAKAQEWQAKVAETRLNMFVANHDWRGAEALYARDRDTLGVRAPEYEKRIATLKNDQQAESAAADLIAKATDPENGKVDTEKAIAAIDSVEAGPLRDEVRQRLEQRVQVADHQWNEKVKSTYNHALSAYLKGGNNIAAVPSTDKAWLLDPKNDAADEWEKLRNIARADVAHARASRSEGAEARREQAERDKLALNEFLSLPTGEQASTDLPGFLAGRGVSDVGASDVKKHQKIATDQVQKGEADSETRFVDQAKAAADKLVRGKENRATYDAEAKIAYRSLTEKLKRPPTREEADKEIVDLVHSAATKPGLIYGFNEEMEYQRRARERVEAIKANKAPVTPAAAPKVPKKDRTLQLIRQGKTNDQIKQTLAAEGY